MNIFSEHFEPKTDNFISRCRNQPEWHRSDAKETLRDVKETSK